MKLGFVTAILPEYSAEEVLGCAAEQGVSSVERMCWPPGRAERRYAGVTHLDVTSPDEIARLRDLSARTGVAISGLGYYPNPLSADPHVSTGSTPGIGVIKVRQGGRSGTFEALAPVTNEDASEAR